MKKGTVSVHLWKKEIYQKHFIDRGLDFEIHETNVGGVLTFVVEYKNIKDYVAALDAAVDECNFRERNKTIIH